MKTDKKTLSFLIVFAIIFVMYNVIFFAVPFPKTAPRGTWATASPPNATPHWAGIITQSIGTPN